MSIVRAATPVALTRGFEEISSLSAGGDGNVAVESAVTLLNNRSLHLSRTSGEASCRFTDTLADAGRRLSFCWRTSALPTSQGYFWMAETSIGGSVLILRVTSTGAIQLDGGGFTKSSAGGVIAANTAHLVAISFVLTSTTNFTIHVWVGTPQNNNLSLALSVTQADGTLAAVGASTSRVLVNSDHSEAISNYFDALVWDDESDLAAIGDVACTPKLLTGDSSITWDTHIGSDPGSGNRYQSLDDRPVDLATGRQQAASTQAAEDFTVQASNVGDVDISTKTIVGAGVWAYAKDGSGAGAAPAQRGSSVTPTGNPSTSATGTIPASVEANDILICAVTSKGSTGAGTLAVTDNEGAGAWVKFANSTDHKATWWWKRASSSTAGKTLTVSNAVTKCGFVLTCFSGCVTSGDPFTDVAVETNSSGDESHAGLTPANGFSMVLAGVHNIDANNSVSSLSFATLGATSMAEKLTGGGGGTCGVALGFAAQSSAAAATGTLTWAQTDGATYSITCALISANPGIASDGTPQLRMDGSDLSAIDLTSVTGSHTAWRTSSTYPSTVGMKSTGTAADTFLYELGAIVVYRSPTGTEFTQSVGGSLTSAAAVMRSARKSATATLTSAGAITKRPARAFTGTASSSGALVKQGRLTFAATLSSAAVLAAMRIVFAVLAGTLASAAALVRTTVRALAAQLSPSAARQAEVRRALAGTVASSATLVPQGQKTAAGTVAPTAAATVLPLKVLSGTLTTAGALVKRTSRAFTGALSSAAVLVALALKALAGTLAPTATLDASQAAEQDLSGTLGSAAGLTKQTQTAKAGTLASSATLSPLAQKALAGTLASAGALTVLVSKLLTAATTPTATLTAIKTALLSLSGTVTSSATLVKQASAVLSGTVTTTGEALKQSAVSASASLASVGAVTRHVAKVLTGALSSSTTLTAVKAALVSLAGTLTSSGALTTTVGRLLAGTVATAAALSRSTTRLLTAALFTAGAVTRETGKGLAAALASAAALANQTQKRVSGAVPSSGALSKQTAVSRTGTLPPSGDVDALTARALTAAVTSAGALTKRTAKALTASLTAAGDVLGNLTDDIVVVITRTLTVAGTLRTDVFVSLAASLAVVGTLAKRVTKTFAGLVGLVGSLVALLTPRTIKVVNVSLASPTLDTVTLTSPTLTEVTLASGTLTDVSLEY